MIEYLGGESPEEATCVYLTRCDVQHFENLDLKRPTELDYFLANDLDVGRSLWDRQALIAHLDIEYVNFDFPAEPYLDLQRSFTLQEPVVAAIKELLAGYAIAPLHLISGRGHHFVWQIPSSARAFERLTELTHSFPTGIENHKRFCANLNETVPEDFTKAFAGLGLVIEFLAQQIKERAAGSSSLPVELTAVETGPGERGREIISVDISEYGDPLHTRMIRLPFSLYLKPLTKEIGLETLKEGRIGKLLMIPGQGLSIRRLIEVIRNPHEAAALAQRASTRIPIFDGAMEGLIGDYLQSRPGKFHRWFYSQEHQPHEEWPQTYDLTPLEILPPCVSRILQQPNDLLLIPAYIQLLVRTMLALGWHPRHIAGLIRSKYERDHGWGRYWFTYDAAGRADFYTRLFAGMFASGTDDLVDFNCLSTQEKRLCFTPGGHCTLDLLKTSLLDRRKDERLGCRPFNRLFLPQEHI